MNTSPSRQYQHPTPDHITSGKAKPLRAPGIVLAGLLSVFPSSRANARPPLRPLRHHTSPHRLARPLHPPPVKPLVTREILILTISRTPKGLRILSQKRARLKKRRPLRRFRGPFEVRLYTRAILRDVITFSFPLSLRAGEPTRTNRRLDSALLAGVARAQAIVRIPWDPTLTHLVLIDHQRHLRTRHSLHPLGARPSTKQRPPASLPSRRLLGAAPLFRLAPTPSRHTPSPQHKGRSPSRSPNIPPPPITDRSPPRSRHPNASDSLFPDLDFAAGVTYAPRAVDQRMRPKSREKSVR